MKNLKGPIMSIMNSIFIFFFVTFTSLITLNAEVTKDPMNGKTSNEITLESYEIATDTYIARTSHEMGESFKIWIDKALSFLPSNAHIIEIGSGFGRDANYIESKGFIVERTDATQNFVKFLQNEGYLAHSFNILTDNFSSKYDLIFANAVFLHFTKEELTKVLHKVFDNLTDNGVLAFSLKHGQGESWTSEKLGSPRYFCYWNEASITSLLESIGFKIMFLSKEERFLQIIVKK